MKYRVVQKMDGTYEPQKYCFQSFWWGWSHINHYPLLSLPGCATTYPTVNLAVAAIKEFDERRLWKDRVIWPLD